MNELRSMRGGGIEPLTRGLRNHRASAPRPGLRSPFPRSNQGERQMGTRGIRQSPDRTLAAAVERAAPCPAARGNEEGRAPPRGPRRARRCLLGEIAPWVLPRRGPDGPLRPLHRTWPCPSAATPRSDASPRASTTPASSRPAAGWASRRRLRPDIPSSLEPACELLQLPIGPERKVFRPSFAFEGARVTTRLIMQANRETAARANLASRIAARCWTSKSLLYLPHGPRQRSPAGVPWPCVHFSGDWRPARRGLQRPGSHPRAFVVHLLCCSSAGANRSPAGVLSRRPWISRTCEP